MHIIVTALGIWFLLRWIVSLDPKMEKFFFPED